MDADGEPASDDVHAVREVLGAGALQRVGSFSYHFADNTWEWSDEVAYMHGYRPGEVTPTTELFLSHKHPDDRTRVGSNLDQIRATGEPFSSRHRIIDRQGHTHTVVVVGARKYDASGRVIGTHGFYIDVTEAIAADMRRSVEETMSEWVDSRAVIDQAKGVLMFVYDIDADRAFDLLTWRSQQANIKVRALSEQLLRAMRSGIDVPLETRDAFNHLFLVTGGEGKRTTPIIAAKLSTTE